MMLRADVDRELAAEILFLIANNNDPEYQWINEIGDKLEANAATKELAFSAKDAVWAATMSLYIDACLEGAELILSGWEPGDILELIRHE